MNNGTVNAAEMLREPIGDQACETEIEPPKARRSLFALMAAAAAAVYPRRALEAVSVIYDTVKWKSTVLKAYAFPTVGIHRIKNCCGTSIFIQKIDGNPHLLRDGQAWSDNEKVVEPAHAGRIPIVELRFPEKFDGCRIEIRTQIYQEGEIRIRQDEIYLTRKPVDAFDEILAEQQANW